jgi:undecaprenyl-diphosphatase
LDVVQAIALGVIQGLTEFLPVSSTGHLILAEKLFGLDAAMFGHAFDAAIHLGTLGAILVYFRRDWVEIAAGFGRSLARRRLAGDEPARLAWQIIVGTVPAVVAGVLLQSKIEEKGSPLSSPVVIAANLAFFGVVLSLTDLVGRKRRSLAQLTWADSLLLGVAQAVALVPGVSRSGITISAGLLRGLKRPDAARFAFLLSAPVVAGAGGKTALDILRKGNEGASPGLLVLLAGVVSSGLVGYLVIRFLMAFLSRRPVHAFSVYRLLLAATIIGLVAVGRLSA